MTIVLAIHGTRSAAGQRTAEQLAKAISQISGQETMIGWIDILEPTLAEVLVPLKEAVVIPWLIGGGYHLLVDVQNVVAKVNPDAVISAPLGDSTALIEALVHNLNQLTPGAGAVGLVWAGSSAPVAHRRVSLISEKLMAATGRRVVAIPMTACETSPQEALRRLRTDSGAAPVVLPLLLAPGFFYDRARGLAEVVGDPIGAHPAVVNWAARCGGLRIPGPGSAAGVGRPVT